MQRRDFIKLSSTLLLSKLSFASEIQNKSVIFVWLSGGSSHFETTHPDSTVDKFQSVTGFVEGKNGLRLGGGFDNLIKHSEYLNIVKSFTHTDAAHEQATHWVNTGFYNGDRSQIPISKHPSYGAIAAYKFGSNINGMPTYVGIDGINGDGSAFLGNQYKPFNPSNKDNLKLSVEQERFISRRNILSTLDKLNENERENAYKVLLGGVYDAFSIEKEPESIRRLYGSGLGEKALLARRLVERGCKFVTLNIGGFDLHSDIKPGMDRLVPQVDIALSALLQDLNSKGMKDTLVVVTTEFGRTAYNATNGRDHFSHIIPLITFGGGYTSGRSIGVTDERNYQILSKHITPADLQYTILNHLGIDNKLQSLDSQGRPTYLVADGTNFLL